MNQNKKLEELFAMYLRWPLYLAAALIVVACITLGIDKMAGLVVLLLTICILAGLFWLYFSSKKNILKAMVGFAKRENSTEGRLTQDLDVPYALSDEKGVWIWKNNAFEALVAADRVERSSVTGMFPDITVEVLKNIVKTVSCNLTVLWIISCRHGIMQIKRKLLLKNSKPKGLSLKN